MRVLPLESPLKGHQPLYIFDFLISVLNIWNNFKVLSRFMQNWTQPPACSEHFYLIKKSALFWFGLRNDEILYLQAATQRTIDASPAFMEYGLVKKIAVWNMQTVNWTSRRIGFNSAWSGPGLWSLLKYSRVKKKKLKTYSGWCPF